MTSAARTTPTHGGPDAIGVPVHDFSTNANACGPCPATIDAIQRADATRYPDPAYTALRERLAAFHGVARERIVLAASASEWIGRFTAVVASGASGAVEVPAHSYGDYTRAAVARGLTVRHRDGRSGGLGARSQWLGEVWNGAGGPGQTGNAHDWNHATGTDAAPGVDGAVDPVNSADAMGGDDAARSHMAVRAIWTCDPASPLGQPAHDLAARIDALTAGVPLVIDRAYEPLRLTGVSELGPNRLDRVWQLWSPNKALGLTGVRGAYAIAPTDDDADWIARLERLAPSWPLGAHAVAMLSSWTDAATQSWLAATLPVLRDWKAQQISLCESLGWTVLPSDANFFCAQPPQAARSTPAAFAQALTGLRAAGIKLRDCASFGLPGHVRLGVLPPASQHALATVWQTLIRTR